MKLDDFKKAIIFPMAFELNGVPISLSIMPASAKVSDEFQSLVAAGKEQEAIWYICKKCLAGSSLEDATVEDLLEILTVDMLSKAATASLHGTANKGEAEKK